MKKTTSNKRGFALNPTQVRHFNRSFLGFQVAVAVANDNY